MVLVDVLQPVALKFVQLLETTDQIPRAVPCKKKETTGRSNLFLRSCAVAGITRSRYLQKLNEISV
jgi:hypothetical protein